MHLCANSVLTGCETSRWNFPIEYVNLKFNSDLDGKQEDLFFMISVSASFVK